MLRDEEGRTHNSTGQLINAEGAVIPDVTDVAETNNFDLNREWYDWGSVDPFRGLPHEDPRDLIKELEELVSASEQNEDIKTAFLNKFLYEATITREKEKNDKWDRFLASLDEEYMIPIQLLDDIMAKRDEQHVSGELSRLEEAGTKDTTSMSIDITTSTSIDITTSTSIDITTLTLIDSMTSMSTDDKTSTSINRSTQKSTDESSCVLVPDVDREITIEDFLELEDKTTPENLDHNLEKKLDDHQHTSEKDLETSLEASIGRHQPDEIDRQPPHIIDLHPPDNDLHRQPLIDRHHPPNIDLFPLLDIPPGCIIEMELIEEMMYMSKASHLDVPKHQRPPIWTEEAAGFHKRVKRIHDPVKIGVQCAVFEVESPIPPDRSMQFSSYIESGETKKEDISKAQAAGRENREIRANPEIGCGFLKNLCRWNRHSGCSALSRTVTRVAPLSGTVIETVLRENHQIALFSASFVPAGASHILCNSRPDEVDKGPTEPVPIDTDRIPSIDTNKPASIDTTTSPSIDTTASLSIDTDRIPSNDTNKPASIDAITSLSIDTVRILEHKEFDVCGNLRDGDTTMRSDKSGGKKKRNWKKRKGIKGDSQLSFITRFSDGVRKSRVRSRCF
ncbi:hypothetical protein DY000_02006777 [Brassica cretica]|uniref:Uncharacterized protein n=1 Tax=Brassica cretica TaxID=69181 RepID=A0ABQ7CFF9_BRACR|nr:hypothetical protein DY000_02006777 [Brassica cretica]